MIGNDWDNILSTVFNDRDFINFYNNIIKLYNNIVIFPPKNCIFNALKLTSYNNVKVVIVGQDPYHGEKEAHGLAFSVQDGIKIPPSLRNIYKELNNDLGLKVPSSGNLTKWAKEGVLLLNSILTVEKDKPLSHQGIGWEKLTDYIIKVLNNKNTPIVFILWGNYARSKKALITNPKHLIIESNHPSPFSAAKGFFNSRPFSKANEFLIKNNIQPVDWTL